MSIKIEVNNTDKLIGSLLVSILILSKNLLQVSSYLFGSTSVFKCAFVFFGIFAFIKFKKKIYLNDVALLAVIFFFFAGTILLANNNMTREIIMNFAIYGLAGYAYSFCQTDEKKIINGCLVIGVMWLFIYIYKNGFDIYNTFSFGYLMLPLTICSLIKVFDKETYIFKRLLHIAVFVIFNVLLVINGSRGPIACYILFILVYLFPMIHSTKKKMVFYIAFILLFVLVLNYKEIVYKLHEVYPGKISFIDKSYLLLSVQSDVTNGRLGIIDSILKEYSLTDFILGIGIGSYESTHPIVGYTHNLMLSLVLDFGLIGLYVFLKSNLVFFKTILEKRDNYLVLLYSVSVIHLMFSGTYWESFEFWLYIFTITKIRFNRNMAYQSRLLH